MSSSQPAFTVLSENEKWKPVLKRMGQLMFSISHELDDSKLLECHHICHKLHFVNNYLQYGKVKQEIKSTKQIKTKKGRGETLPKAEVVRALQRMTLLLMSGYLMNPLPMYKTKKNESQNKFTFINSIVVSLKEENEDVIIGLGYGNLLRNWIYSETNKLEMIVPKSAKKTQPETSKDATTITKLQNQLDVMENQTIIAKDNLLDGLNKMNKTVEEMQTKNMELEEKVGKTNAVLSKHEAIFRFFFKCYNDDDAKLHEIDFMEPPVEGQKYVLPKWSEAKFGN